MTRHCFMVILHESMGPGRPYSNSGPLDLQFDSHQLRKGFISNIILCDNIILINVVDLSYTLA